MITFIKKRLSAVRFIQDLLSQGRRCFTTQEAFVALKVSPLAARAALRRLKAKGLVATPVRGFHVIVTPEYHCLSCLPAELFIHDLMGYLGKPYYAGLLTAAQIHGAAQQQPQVFQVVTPVNRKQIVCGKVAIQFIAKRSMNGTPKSLFKTASGFFFVSTPEITAMDLTAYPHHSGGLSNLATSIGLLCEKMDVRKLRDGIKSLGETAPVQRLGYLLDQVLKRRDLALPLLKIVRKEAGAVVPLVPSLPRQGARIDRRWKVLVNAEVELDL